PPPPATPQAQRGEQQRRRQQQQQQAPPPAAAAAAAAAAAPAPPPARPRPGRGGGGGGGGGGMEVGMRVVRGLDWKWGNQDDAEGHMGTVVEIGRQGSTTTPDKTVVVHCKKHGIMGMRWKCKVCFDYDLCTQCYMNNKHDLGHAFERYETAHSQPVSLAPRQNLPRITLKGIFQGVKVVRGPDWDWGNQDGGEGKVGKVVDIRGWDTESGRSVASVTWTNGTTNVYRMGHKGKVDLKYISDVQGGFYYKDHLPKLGEHAELQRQDSADGHSFQQGDKVKCLLEVEILRQMQEGHGGWNPKMAEYISRIGTVHRITDRGTSASSPGAGGSTPTGDLRVAFGGHTWTFNPACLSTPVGGGGRQPHDARRTPASTVISVLEKLLAQSTEQDNPGRLVIEAAHGSASKVRELVQKYPDKVDIKNQGKTALQVAAHQGHLEVVRVLLQASSSVEVKDEDGDTALHYTAFGNQPEIARLLLSQGASVNQLNSSTCTALHDSYGDTPLHDAIAKDFRGIMETLVLVPNIDFTQQNHRGFNLLHHAALKGNKLATERILARARQLVDVKKDDGFSALHLAALNNHWEGRCDVNIRNNRNQTALQLVVTQGHEAALLCLLVAHGADVNMEDEDGDTARHVALSRPQLANTALTPARRPGTTGTARTGTTAATTRRHQWHRSTTTTTSNTTSNTIAEDPTESPTATLYSRLSESGLLGTTELTLGTAIACFLAREGADIHYANHKGKSPLDLVGDPALRLQAITCGQGLSGASLRRVHTTPNTMTNLALPAPPGPSECLICSELALLVLFCPCQHSVACEECAHRMKKCIKCQVTITKKIRQDGGGLQPRHENSEQHNLLEQLQSRYRQMEERITCPICIDNHIKLVFQCGHASCIDCSAALKACPICRQTIRSASSCLSEPRHATATSYT
ncbi:hypothetical protein CRUP_008032, partial [Coryphaenoides rupestris]